MVLHVLMHASCMLIWQSCVESAASSRPVRLSVYSPVQLLLCMHVPFSTCSMTSIHPTKQDGSLDPGGEAGSALNSKPFGADDCMSGPRVAMDRLDVRSEEGSLECSLPKRSCSHSSAGLTSFACRNRARCTAMTHRLVHGQENAWSERCPVLVCQGPWTRFPGL